MTDLLADDAVDEVAELKAAVAELTVAVRDMAKPRVEVRAEPATYREDLPVSYFRDLVFADRDRDAAARLNRHAAEWAARLERRDREGHAALSGLGVEYRVTPGTTYQGQGAYFAPPLWLIDQFATAPRTGRVLAGLIPSFPLPRGTSSINLPRLPTGTVANGVPDNTAVDEQDVVDAAVDGTIVTISGLTDWPLQALEQSPAGGHLDSVMFQDLSEAYDYSYEQQLIAGGGANSATDTSGQLLGITRVTGINKVTFTSASPTFTLLSPLLGQAIAQVGDKRLKPPQCWLMTTSRWAWIASALDSSNRPLTPPDTSAPPPLPVDGTGSAPSAIGALLGRWPVYLDDAIPVTYSGSSVAPGGGTQDAIIACRPTDMLLLESAPTVMVTREPLSGTVGVRFVYRRNVSALTARYPTGTAVIVGSGQAVQSGF